MQSNRQVVVSGSFDDVRLGHLRFLEEASKLGDVNVLLWPDEVVEGVTGKAPTFSLAEREYFVDAVGYVKRVCVAGDGRDR